MLLPWAASWTAAKSSAGTQTTTSQAAPATASPPFCADGGRSGHAYGIQGCGPTFWSPWSGRMFDERSGGAGPRRRSLRRFFAIIQNCLKNIIKHWRSTALVAPIADAAFLQDRPKIASYAQQTPACYQLYTSLTGTDKLLFQNCLFLPKTGVLAGIGVAFVVMIL